MMRVANKRVSKMVADIKRSDCTNNTQRVLLDLIKTRNKTGWVGRTTLQVPSASARVRDLRKSQFGAVMIECATASDLKRPAKNGSTACQTFYRVNPRSITETVVSRVFKGVITNS